jgi:hypothetical protein
MTMADKAEAFADDQREELLSRTESGEALTVICTDPRMPSRSTVYEWIENDEAFAGRFRAARARGVHAMAEQCLLIADETPKDAVHVSDKRVRIDTRLRLAGKWLPKDYGDKVAHVGGDEGDAPIAVALTPTEAARRLAFTLARGVKAQTEPTE